MSGKTAQAAGPRRVEQGERVTNLDEVVKWPDAMVASARERARHFSACMVTDPHRLAYFTFEDSRGNDTEGVTDGQAPASSQASQAAGSAPAPDVSAASPGEAPRAGRPDEGPEGPVPVAPGFTRDVGPRAPVDRHPLAYAAGTLDKLQDALDARSPGRFVANRPDLSFATLTTGETGAPRAWGRNVLTGPRMLSVAGGVPPQRVQAVFAQFPQLTLPTAQPLSGEGTALVEYASSAAGSVTLGRFGRWTDMSRESLIGADAAAVTSMHRVGIALDLDKVLVDAVDTAAGAAVAFDADVPASIRRAIARVLANTAADDPTALVALVNPDDAHLLEDVQPTGGQTIAEQFQRFSGALVYPTTAQPTGFITVANLRAGARYFEAMALQTLTDVDVKTSVETVATFIIAGYGVTLTSGFAVKQDVVTP